MAVHGLDVLLHPLQDALRCSRGTEEDGSAWAAQIGSAGWHASLCMHSLIPPTKKLAPSPSSSAHLFQAGQQHRQVGGCALLLRPKHRGTCCRPWRRLSERRAVAAGLLLLLGPRLQHGAALPGQATGPAGPGLLQAVCGRRGSQRAPSLCQGHHATASQMCH